MKKYLVMIILIRAFFVPAFSQQPGSEPPDYKQMLEDAMKSSKYSQGQTENWDARLKRVSGEVFVKQESSEEWSKIEGSIPLEYSDSVKTGSDGTAEIYLDNKGAMTLGRSTELEVSSIDQTDSIFKLKTGSIAAKIQHFMNEKFKMQVHTPSAVCAIRGTEFAVEYSPFGMATGVAVYDEGKVAVSLIDEDGAAGQEYTLEKNTELTFKPSQKHFRPTALAKMARYRAGVILMRQRVTALGKTWRPVSQTKRSVLRDEALKRRIIRRQIKNSKPKTGGRAVKSGVRPKARRAAPAQEQEEQ